MEVVVDSSVKSFSDLGISPTGGKILNMDALRRLVDEHPERLSYFTELWPLVMNLDKPAMEACPCDPRDVRKKQYLESWVPSAKSRHFDLDNLDVKDNDDSSSGRLSVKQTVLTERVEDSNSSSARAASRLSGNDCTNNSFPCGVYGCGQVLQSIASYEAHYRHCHNHVCATCRRVFVSNFLLDVHLEENHDSYFAVLSPRVNMYRCLVESCTEKFRTAELRKDHTITVHKFPSNFSFHQPVRDKGCKDSAVLMEVTHPGVFNEASGNAEEMELSPALTSANHKNAFSGRGKKQTTAKHRVPTSICFGRGSQKAFQQTRGRRGRGGYWYRPESTTENCDTAVNIECVDMKDLEKALE